MPSRKFHVLKKRPLDAQLSKFASPTVKSSLIAIFGGKKGPAAAQLAPRTGGGENSKFPLCEIETRTNGVETVCWNGLNIPEVRPAACEQNNTGGRAEGAAAGTVGRIAGG